jgi:hypothetical protein
LLGSPDLAFLVLIRPAEPLVQAQRVTGGIENCISIIHLPHVVQLQAQTLKHGGQVPRINQAAVHCSLSAHCFQPGPVQKGGLQRVRSKCLIQPSHSVRGPVESSALLDSPLHGPFTDNLRQCTMRACNI